MTGVSGLNANIPGNLSSGLSKKNSTTSNNASSIVSAQPTAAQQRQKDSLTMMLSEIRLSMVQSLFDEDFSFSPLESLTTSLYDSQAITEASMFQANPGMSQSILSSDSLGQALDSLSPALELMKTMEGMNLSPNNPDQVQALIQTLESNHAEEFAPDSPGSILDLLA
jgi:hypothetical protein